VIGQKGVLPQQADKVDPSLPIAEDELLIEVESLNIDSASFHQIAKACGDDLERIEGHILDLVSKRGKHHNPVTGSGGMLIGTVLEVGPKYPVRTKPVKVGDRIASLVEEDHRQQGRFMNRRRGAEGGRLRHRCDRKRGGK
jgi:L-erythro-3,5-diaminohexanoate dehydrogenase